MTLTTAICGMIATGITAIIVVVLYELRERKEQPAEPDAGPETAPPRPESYRPANGAEGMDFMEDWCCRCQFFNQELGCPILNATFLLSQATDDEYPNQWRDNPPRCTSFVLRNDLRMSQWNPTAKQP